MGGKLFSVHHHQPVVFWQPVLALLALPICENRRTNLARSKYLTSLLAHCSKKVALSHQGPHPSQQEVRGQSHKEIQAAGASPPATALRNGRGGVCKAVFLVTKGNSFVQLYSSGCKRAGGPTRPRRAPKHKLASTGLRRPSASKICSCALKVSTLPWASLYSFRII